jgi:hypothetical protein
MKTTIGTLIIFLFIDLHCFGKQFKNDDNYPFSFNPNYEAPSTRIRFYNKSGLVNTTIKYRKKRLNHETEWAILQRNIARRKIQKVKIVDSDFASVLGTDYYQKNGLVSVSKKYLNRRQKFEMQFPLIYGRDLSKERYKKYEISKQKTPSPTNKIMVKSPVKQKHNIQEVVNPR